MLDYTNASTIYLSQSEGNDHYSGFSPIAMLGGAGPVKTMDRVMDMLWNMRACGVLQPISVKIMGDYYLEKPIKIGFEYANGFFARTHKMKNITFESYGDARSKIIGGRRLTGFQKDTFNGVDCISLHIPEVKAGNWMFSDLYVGGKRASLTRYPKKGTLRALDTENPNPTIFTKGSRWFIANKEDLAQIDDVESTIVSYYHFWIDEHSPVESYDRETGKLTMELRSRFQISANYERNGTMDLHYYLENVPTTFSSPNEWFLDVKNGMLYYIPEDPDTPIDGLEIYAPTQEQLVLVKGTADNPVAGIRFRNLDFLCSKGDYKSMNRFAGDPDAASDEGFAADAQSVYDAYGAISFAYAEDCAVTDCSVSCVGLHAVEMHCGCHNVRVEQCRMENLGGGGIKIFGRTVEEPAEQETAHCVVKGNLIRNIGKRFAAACGVLVIHSSHNEISDNEICYTDYSGVSVGWVWGFKESTTYGNLIRNNHIHHIGMGKLSDMGGIYLLGPQNGTVVEGNHIHDINSAHYGGWGIYTDEGSAYITIEKNIVYNCKSQCYHQHYGQYNTVRDNIFAFGGQHLIRMSRGDAHVGIIVENNTLITDGRPIYDCFDDSFKGAVLSLKSSGNRIWDVSGRAPVMVQYQENGAEYALSLSEWQAASGKDIGSVVAEPIDIEMDRVNRKITRK
ncbi:MAG: right-handed parallel beta-helix repeat-containing protein [Clostridia bacterium]|nr:right-handed parallel beta-helix repeat-containing protein [Clostridia bacterium]